MEHKIKIGITHGDYNGVGYEVILKTLSDQRILELFTPVLYGSQQLLHFHRRGMNIAFNTPIKVISSIEDASPGEINLFPVDELGIDAQVRYGEPSRTAGCLAARALMDAREHLLDHQIDAVVTAPINKDTIQSDEFNFKGHTEFFAEPFSQTHEPVMLFCSNQVRVALVTMHYPYAQVPLEITPERLNRAIIGLEETLQQDFGLVKPRIAVLGLNPHAGENGLLGKEEKEIISPVIEEAWNNGKMVFGPYPADGFWGSGSYHKFDAVLSMYHDQGLIPFKLLAMNEGVNITAGLPIIRTSPDHGTAYDIAGKGEADETSFRNAIYQAIDIYNHRQAYLEATSNPLRKRYVEKGSDNVRLDFSKNDDDELLSL